jgi:hypothetical protein
MRQWQRIFINMKRLAAYAIDAAWRNEEEAAAVCKAAIAAYLCQLSARNAAPRLSSETANRDEEKSNF